MAYLTCQFQGGNAGLVPSGQVPSWEGVQEGSVGLGPLGSLWTRSWGGCLEHLETGLVLTWRRRKNDSFDHSMKRMMYMQDEESDLR